MNRIILSLCVILSVSSALYSQRKSDLIAEIENLKSQLDSVNSEVVLAKKNEKVSLARAESYENQVVELQDANATLMKNLNTFAEISSKNSDNVNRAMASLQNKENQLKAIKDAIAKNDSTAIVVLTDAKRTLGENARISVVNGAVIISESLDALFGGDTNVAVMPTAESYLGQIAQLLNANPKMAVTIEGLSMTGNLDLPAKQAFSVADVLETKFSIDPNRITALGRDGNLKEGVLLKIHPKFDEFYLMVKENMKN